MSEFQKIFKDNSEFRIWKKLDNGCYIGTLGYSKKNIQILQSLLMSFSEHYGEVIDYEAAKEELKLYEDFGKLFIYFDEKLNPVSMNGCIYDYDNETVDFISSNGNKLHSIYFYGLSTLPYYRGKGACRTLIKYAIAYAKANNFDYVYARTDLVGSMSEALMKLGGLDVCKYEDKIITEWVEVTEEKGDYRLHMWKPLHDNLDILPKGKYLLANDDSERKIINKEEKNKGMVKKYGN